MCSHPSSRLLSGVCYFRIPAQRVLSQVPGPATICPEVGLALQVAREWPFLAAVAGSWMCRLGWAPPLWERPCTCWEELEVGREGELGCMLGARVKGPARACPMLPLLGAEFRGG